MDDLYGDLDNYESYGDVNKLKEENEKLKRDLQEKNNIIEKLTKTILQDYDSLLNSYKTVEKNFSSLLMTARSEIERKTLMISELNREKDALIFKRNVVPFKGQHSYGRENKQPQSNRTVETNVKRKFIDDNMRGKTGDKRQKIECLPSATGRNEEVIDTKRDIQPKFSSDEDSNHSSNPVNANIKIEIIKQETQVDENVDSTQNKAFKFDWNHSHDITKSVDHKKENFKRNVSPRRDINYESRNYSSKERSYSNRYSHLPNRRSSKDRRQSPQKKGRSTGREIARSSYGKYREQLSPDRSRYNRDRNTERGRSRDRHSTDYSRSRSKHNRNTPENFTSSSDQPRLKRKDSHQSYNNNMNHGKTHQPEIHKQIDQRHPDPRLKYENYGKTLTDLKVVHYDCSQTNASVTKVTEALRSPSNNTFSTLEDGEIIVDTTNSSNNDEPIECSPIPHDWHIVDEDFNDSNELVTRLSRRPTTIYDRRKGMKYLDSSSHLDKSLDVVSSEKKIEGSNVKIKQSVDHLNDDVSYKRDTESQNIKKCKKSSIFDSEEKLRKNESKNKLKCDKKPKKTKFKKDSKNKDANNINASNKNKSERTNSSSEVVTKLELSKNKTECIKTHPHCDRDSDEPENSMRKKENEEKQIEPNLHNKTEVAETIINDSNLIKNPLIDKISNCKSDINFKSDTDCCILSVNNQQNEINETVENTIYKDLEHEVELCNSVQVIKNKTETLSETITQTNNLEEDKTLVAQNEIEKCNETPTNVCIRHFSEVSKENEQKNSFQSLISSTPSCDRTLSLTSPKHSPIEKNDDTNVTNRTPSNVPILVMVRKKRRVVKT